MGARRWRALMLTLAALAAAGCASFGGPRGTFTARDFDAQRPGRLLFEYPIDSTKKPRVDASHVVFDDHAEAEAVPKKGMIILRPPSRAKLLHGKIDLEVRDRWMMQQDGSSKFYKSLWVAVPPPQITRFPAGGVNGDSTHVDSLILRATGLTIKVSRRATVSVARDTVRITVLRQ